MKKIILATAALLLLVTLAFFILSRNTNEDQGPATTTPETPRTNWFDRSDAPDVRTTPVSPPNTDEQPVQPRNDKEVEKNLSVSENISKWKQTGDQTYLIEALALSAKPDNESVFDSWVPVIESDPESVLLPLAASTTASTSLAILGARSVIGWYVELSEGYIKLNDAGRQKILRIRQQLEII